MFYTAAELNKVQRNIAFAAMQTLLEIVRKCHVIVMSGNYVLSIEKKLEKARTKAANYVLRVLKDLITMHNKVKWVTPQEVPNEIPKDDRDVASFAMASKDKVLIVANIDRRPADERLVSVLTRYGIKALTCEEFLAHSM